MKDMFNQCKNLQLLDVSNFNTENVTSMYAMFYNCPKLSSLNVSNFNTAKVTNMSRMFYGCQKITSLELTSFNTSNVTDMSYMFYNCKLIVNLDLSSFDVRKVKSLFGTFWKCESLVNLDLSSFVTDSLEDICGFLRDCTNLITVDISNFNTSKIAKASYAFASSRNLKTIYVSQNINFSVLSDDVGMFMNASALIGGNGTVYDSNHYDKTYAVIDKVYTKGYLTEKGYSSNLIFDLPSNKSEVTSEYMKYSISNNVISVTGLTNDGHGFTTGRVTLYAGRTYAFDCTINTGTWPSLTEAFLMLNGQYSHYYYMAGNNHYEFTPTTTGTYWLRLDVNGTDRTVQFSDIMIREKIT